jgi:hypothetical protein
VPPLLIFLVEKFANINPVISGWSFSLRKKVESINSTKAGNLIVECIDN